MSLQTYLKEREKANRESNRLYGEFTDAINRCTSVSTVPKSILTIYPRIDGTSYYSSVKVYVLDKFWILIWDKWGRRDDEETYYFIAPQLVADFLNVCIIYWGSIMPSGCPMPLALRGITGEDLRKFVEKPAHFDLGEYEGDE